MSWSGKRHNKAHVFDTGQIPNKILCRKKEEGSTARLFRRNGSAVSPQREISCCTYCSSMKLKHVTNIFPEAYQHWTRTRLEMMELEQTPKSRKPERGIIKFWKDAYKDQDSTEKDPEIRPIEATKKRGRRCPATAKSRKKLRVDFLKLFHQRRMTFARMIRLPKCQRRDPRHQADRYMLWGWRFRLFQNLVTKKVARHFSKCFYTNWDGSPTVVSEGEVLVKPRRWRCNAEWHRNSSV